MKVEAIDRRKQGQSDAAERAVGLVHDEGLRALLNRPQRSEASRRAEEALDRRPRPEPYGYD